MIGVIYFDPVQRNDAGRWTSPGWIYGALIDMLENMNTLDAKLKRMLEQCRQTQKLDLAAIKTEDREGYENLLSNLKRGIHVIIHQRPRILIDGKAADNAQQNEYITAVARLWGYFHYWRQH